MKKKNIIIIILFLFVFWIWKDYKKIDFKYINQSGVTHDYKNLNNNFIKKIHHYINNNYENFLVNFINNHKNYWVEENIEQRKNFEDFKEIKSLGNFTPSNNISESTNKNWYRSHGNNFSNRYSNLDQINSKNATNLKIAWVFESKGYKKDIQANPIVINGIIYTPISGGYIAAIDGVSGKLKWKSKQFGNFVAKRGLIYWPGETKKEIGPRIIFSDREKLISLDAKNGKIVNSFGGDGSVRTGLNVLAPIIYKNLIIIATWERAFEAYDLYSGKTKWKIKYYKKNNSRVGGKKYNSAGANPWGGISADLKRGILYVTTGNPHHYFDGTQRPGNNLFSNSIIALDINKKRILWNFQETSHDIWNSDLPAPPVLTSIKYKSNLIDVVVTPTKRANTLILDRLSGKPVFDFHLKKAPTSNIPGEKTSVYQPDLKIPEPFGKNVFNLEDLKFSKYSADYEKYKNHNFGFYATYSLNKKNLQYNFNGGAEWMGASIDPKKNIMYVTSNNILWETGLNKNDTNKQNGIPTYTSFFKRALDKKGYPINRPPWGTLTSLNLNTGKIIWQVPFGEYKELTEEGYSLTGTENFGGATSTAGNIVIATGTLDKKVYIFNSDNGKVIHSINLPYIGSAPPTTFMAEKEQYIIIHATGGSTLKQGYPEIVETGNKIIALKLY